MGSPSELSFGTALGGLSGDFGDSLDGLADAELRPEFRSVSGLKDLLRGMSLV